MSFTTKNSKQLILRIFDDAFIKGYMENSYDLRDTKYNVTLDIVFKDDLKEDPEMLVFNVDGFYKIHLEHKSVLNENVLNKYIDRDHSSNYEDGAFLKIKRADQFEEILDGLKLYEIRNIGLTFDEEGIRKKRIFFLKNLIGESNEINAIKEMVDFYKIQRPINPPVFNSPQPRATRTYKRRKSSKKLTLKQINKLIKEIKLMR